MASIVISIPKRIPLCLGMHKCNMQRGQESLIAEFYRQKKDHSSNKNPSETHFGRKDKTNNKEKQHKLA